MKKKKTKLETDRRYKVGHLLYINLRGGQCFWTRGLENYSLRWETPDEGILKGWRGVDTVWNVDTLESIGFSRDLLLVTGG